MSLDVKVTNKSFIIALRKKSPKTSDGFALFLDELIDSKGISCSLTSSDAVGGCGSSVVAGSNDVVGSGGSSDAVGSGGSSGVSDRNNAVDNDVALVNDVVGSGSSGGIAGSSDVGSGGSSDVVYSQWWQQ